MTELLTDIQSQVGTITKDNVQEIVSEIAEGSITLGSNVTCTDCTKAMYNLVDQADPSIASTYNSTVVSQCGASFTGMWLHFHAIGRVRRLTFGVRSDGSEPSTISQTANENTASNNTSGALSASSPIAAVAISSFVTVSSVFALLA